MLSGLCVVQYESSSVRHYLSILWNFLRERRTKGARHLQAKQTDAHRKGNWGVSGKQNSSILAKTVARVIKILENQRMEKIFTIN